jgi:hypothetical protein
VTLLPEGFGHFVTSIAAPVASGWSDLAGWGFHPLESAALARRTDKPDMRRNGDLTPQQPYTVRYQT